MKNYPKDPFEKSFDPKLMMNAHRFIKFSFFIAVVERWY
jgi:hypothetical protein